MKARPVWAFSAIAFDISRRDRVPCLIQRAFVRLGTASFWTALILEGRALEVWRELQYLRSGADAAAAAIPAGVVDRMKSLLGARPSGECPVVPAWSLPENQKIRSLGLGRMWAVLCPFCEEFHTHSPGEARRIPHCCTDQDAGQYLLEHAGPLPLEHRARFCQSSKTWLPRLLHQWEEASFEDADAPKLIAA